MYFKACISGLTAVGKTSLARELVKRYRAEYLSASVILLELAKERAWISEAAEATSHFWLRESGKALFREREISLGLDREVDERLLAAVGSPKKSIIDSLTVPLLLPSRNCAFSVLLRANLTQRAERAWLSSPTMSKKELQQGVKEKDEKTAHLLGALWGIDIMQPPLDRYDLVIWDARLESVVGGVRGVKSQREIAAKLRVMSVFLDVYEQIVQPTLSRKKLSALIARCRQVRKRYGPIIKKFPYSFLSLGGFDRVDWERRNVM